MKAPPEPVKRKRDLEYKSNIRIKSIPNNLFVSNKKVFNCGIIDYHGATKLLYRYELPYGDYNTEIGICDLDDFYQPKNNTNFKVNIIRHNSRVTTFDDPRPFVLNEELYFTFAQGMVVPFEHYNGWCCSIGLAKIRGNNVSIPVIPKYGVNVNASSIGNTTSYSQEKNWMPLIHKNTLYFVYKINPLTIIECDPVSGDCREVCKDIEYDLTFWREGDFFGGGTPFIYYDEKYYSFFHTFTLEKPGTPSARRYHVGLIALDEKFRICEISSKPIMSAEMDEGHDLRPLQNWWRPNVIFPCGLVMRKIENRDFFVMSYGWQDCRCKIAEIPVSEARRGMVKPKLK